MSESPGFEAIAGRIIENPALVIDRWEEMIGEEPWSHLERDERIDALPRVVIRLVEVTLKEPYDPAEYRTDVHAAAVHGEHRREQGVDEDLIYREYHYLRQAFWEYFEEVSGSRREMTEAIQRIDSAITLATMASLYGFHQQEMENEDAYRRKIESLADDSPLTPDHGGSLETP